jgi:hypothetical protein
MSSLSYPTFAFPTQETNAVGHQRRTKYDFNTGLVKVESDPRLLNTSYAYDLMNRITSIAEPNGGVTSYSYDDVTPKMTEQRQLAAGSFLTTETWFDKFYRTTRTIVQDPAGNSTVDIVYDGDGRVRQVSEPYRSGSPVWTTTTYDVLNRPLTATHPDNSVRQTIYFGNAEQVIDEANNSRYFTYNGLGQLKQVEAGNPSVPTIYSYYVFGPLYRVNQSGLLPRTFTHDWLSRMLNETHPESGSTSYQNDDDGRVSSRLDARGITTNYSYDAIDGC